VWQPGRHEPGLHEPGLHEPGAPVKQHAPATQRNREPILELLRQVLPTRGTVLEIAAGTGQHASYFAAALPQLVWQPTDTSPEALASIEAWRAEAGLPNLRPALPLDVTGTWPVGAVDAVYSANMVHISPWDCTLALLAGAAERLPAGGPLVLYGPYRRARVPTAPLHQAPTAPSNEAFDASLRARDPRWGLRELEEVLRQAQARGLELDRIEALPANNLAVVLRRSPLRPS